MQKSVVLRQWANLPQSVRLGLATVFAVMGVSLAEIDIALYLLNSWRAATVGMVAFCGSFFAGGVVIVRDWSNLRARYRAVGALWAILGIVPILLALRLLANHWGRIAEHAG